MSNFVFANLLSNLENCRYYDITLTIDYSNHQNKCFSIVHTNIRPLYKNFDSRYDILQTFGLKPDLICLSETKLKDFPFMNQSIPNCIFYHSPSPLNAGGVVVDFSSKRFLDLTLQYLNTDQCENLFVKLSNQDGINHFVYGTVYRHLKCSSKVLIENLEVKRLPN